MNGNINTETITSLQLIVKHETLEDLHVKPLVTTTKMMILDVVLELKF